MIDEKKLIELCKDLKENETGAFSKGYNKALRDVISTVKSDGFQKVGEWIPCSENLPENTRTVIVDVEELRNPTFAFYMKLSKKWVLVERDFIYLEDFHVLAWMPLPAPYKEDMRGGENG